MDRFDDEIESLGEAAIGAAIEVHRHLGPGHTESVYCNALSREFVLRGIEFEREYPFDVRYKDDVVGQGRIDFWIEGRLVLEVKALKELHDAHVGQVIFYLSNMGEPLGLLINFNTSLLRKGIRRVVLRIQA